MPRSSRYKKLVKLTGQSPSRLPVALLIACAALQAFGQNITLRGTDTLRVVVENVVDRRDAGKTSEIFNRYRGECQLRLNFDGGPITPDTVLLRVRITNALDNTGRDLLPTNRTATFDQWPLEPVDGTYHMHGASKVTISLQMPARQATTIRTVQGDVEFYLPNRTKSNVLTFDEITATQPFNHPLLKNFGIELTPLDRARLSAEERKRKTQSETPKFLQDVLINTLSNAWLIPRFQTNMVVLEMIDPKQMVAYIELLDAGHRRFKHSPPIRLGDFILFPTPLSKDMKARVHLALPEVIHRFPFRVEHVPLP